MKRRKRLRRVSEKRLLLLGERIEMLEGLDRSVCAAAPLVPAVDCAGPVDPHEPLTRARGGSVVDPANVLMVCRKHHGWIHRHPLEAHDLGLLVHSWERVDLTGRWQ